MRTSSTPELPGAHPDDIATLTRAVATIDGGAIIVTADDPMVAADVAAAVATADASYVWARRGDQPDRALSDVHVMAPTAVMWTVADIERLIATASRRPIHRMHLIIVNAHQMAQLAADRLLKIVEEPRTDVIFWFATPTVTALPVTLVSRTARTAHVRPLPLAHRHQALVDAGASETDASEILTLAGPNARLAGAVATAGALPSLRTVTAYPPALAAGTADLTTVDDLVAAIAELTDALTGTRRRSAPTGDGRGRWGKLDPAGRAHGRALIAALLDQVTAAAAAQVAHAATAPALRHLERVLHAADQARGELGTNAHPATVLGALTARVTASR